MVLIGQLSEGFQTGYVALVIVGRLKRHVLGEKSEAGVESRLGGQGHQVLFELKRLDPILRPGAGNKS